MAALYCFSPNYSDLSNNCFNGSIPEGFWNASAVSSMFEPLLHFTWSHVESYLQNNQLSGLLPGFISPGLKHVYLPSATISLIEYGRNLGHNKLNGAIPLGMRSLNELYDYSHYLESKIRNLEGNSFIHGVIPAEFCHSSIRLYEHTTPWSFFASKFSLGL